MKRNLDKYLNLEDSLKIADLGSYNVNGCYRTLMPENYSYVGIDREAGPNVDVVMTAEYKIPLEDDSFDVLISGQCFEHVRNPFRLMTEAARIVKPKGKVMLTAPFRFAEHRYPIDCWRFLSDGWRAIFEECNITMIHTEYIEAHKSNVDCWAIGEVNGK
jgi:SAM-dependent methyltransferase